jgi:hypothetical protein
VFGVPLALVARLVIATSVLSNWQHANRPMTRIAPAVFWGTNSLFNKKLLMAIRFSSQLLFCISWKKLVWP